MKLFAVFAIAAVASQTSAYTEQDRTEVNEWLSGMGFPILNAFNQMTPKMLKTLMSVYPVVKSEGAYEHFTALDVEVIFTAVSAINNCELCLSFHAMGLKGMNVSIDNVEAIVHGGIPADKKLAGLVTASKYAMSHNGILLEREKIHLAEAYGIEGSEVLAELNMIVGMMRGFNQIYVHLLGEGLVVEDFVGAHGAFAETYYKDRKPAALEVVQTAFMAWGTDDTDSIGSWMAEDGIIDASAQFKNTDIFKKYTGVKGMTEFWKNLKTMEFPDFTPNFIPVDAETVYVSVNYTPTISATGAKLDHKITDMQSWKVKDGKITSMRMYMGSVPEIDALFLEGKSDL